MKKKWKTDVGFHVPKLMLLEIWPLTPFIGQSEGLNVIDVGCNVGVWCQAFMNTYGEQVKKYHGIDPLEGNLKVFKERISDDLLPSSENIVLHHGCMGPSNGEVEIHYNNEVSTLASVVLDSMQVGSRTVRNDKKRVVKQSALTSFCKEHDMSNVDLLKIDVEGYEWDVLMGAKELLNSKRLDMVLFEFGQHQGALGQSFKQFWDLLSGHDFHIYRQAVGRNFFGMQHLERYDRSLEKFDSMWMILASRKKHDEKLNSPLVIGRYPYPKVVRARRGLTGLMERTFRK